MFQHHVGAAEHRVRDDLRRFHCENDGHQCVRVDGQRDHEVHSGHRRYRVRGPGDSGRTSKRDRSSKRWTKQL